MRSFDKSASEGMDINPAWAAQADQGAAIEDESDDTVTIDGTASEFSSLDEQNHSTSDTSADNSQQLDTEKEASADATWPAGIRHRDAASVKNGTGEMLPSKDEKEEKGHEGAKPKKKVKKTGSSPVHTELRESPLSSNAIFHQSHAGLVNLCIVVLVAVNGRLIIDNLMKYGILIRTGMLLTWSSWRDWPLFICGLSLSVFPLAALAIELLRRHRAIPNGAVAVLHTLNIAAEFFYPAIVICTLKEPQPLGCFALIFATVVLWMKLVSYSHVHEDIRQRVARGEKVVEHAAGTDSVAYPENLTVANMLYFIAAPTLCYQLVYPRTGSIRQSWLLQQFAMLAVFLALMLIIVEQYINPTIWNSKHPFEGHLVDNLSTVLKLSIPTLYVWLCMFFCLFHLWLNILAELLRFGDREFYRDWWNARTVEEYWRLWNMPVHRWLVRHVYFPTINAGLSKGAALFVVFFLSAVFHEVLIGIPCRMFRLWAFLGMMFQIPLVFLTKELYHRSKSPTVGNMLFWFFFCIVGQPICVLLYYHDVQLSMQQRGASA